MIATCPACKSRYRLDASRLKGGHGRLKCARCGEIFGVEAPRNEPLAAPAPTPPQASPPAPPPDKRAESPDKQNERPEAVRRLLSASRGSRGGIAVAIVACEAGPLRETLVSALARAGVRTLTTDDGPSCLDMARRTRPKLVVAASYLPGLTGPELAQALRAEPLLAGAHVVLLAAAGTPAPPPGAVNADVVLPSADCAAALGKLLPDLLATEHVEHELDREQARLLERQARVAAHELSLYHPGSGDRAALEAEAEETRQWLAEQWPQCPQRARRLFDEALRETDAS